MTPNEKTIQELRREVARLKASNETYEKRHYMDTAEIMRLRRLNELERGGILSGRKMTDEIRAGRIVISDFDSRRVNPNSYNLHLADELLIYRDDVLDMKKENRFSIMKIPETGMELVPGTLYLGRTMEHTSTDYYVPLLDGRSSVGRLGVSVHATAGFGDIGFSGFWTLEIFCVQPVRIYPGVEICQIYYHTIVGDYDKYTSGKYQHNSGVQPSLMFRDFVEVTK